MQTKYPEYLEFKIIDIANLDDFYGWDILKDYSMEVVYNDSYIDEAVDPHYDPNDTSHYDNDTGRSGPNKIVKLDRQYVAKLKTVKFLMGKKENKVIDELNHTIKNVRMDRERIMDDHNKSIIELNKLAEQVVTKEQTIMDQRMRTTDLEIDSKNYENLIKEQTTTINDSTKMFKKIKKAIGELTFNEIINADDKKSRAAGAREL